MSDSGCRNATECDEHKWEVKGGGGNRPKTSGFALLQCMECGKAKRQTVKSDGVFYTGWYDEGEGEEEEAESSSGGGLFG